MTLRNSARRISQISEFCGGYGLIETDVLMVVLHQQQEAFQRRLAEFHSIPLVWQRHFCLQKIHNHLPEGCERGSISAANCIITYVFLRCKSSVPADLQGSNTSTPTMRPEAGTPDWTVAEVQEFVPSGFEGTHVVSLDRSCHLSFRNISTSCINISAVLRQLFVITHL